MNPHPPAVTAQERLAFDTNGFHVVRGALSLAEIQSLRAAVQRLWATPADHAYADRLREAEVPLEGRPADNPRALWNGFDLPLFDDRFYDLIFHPRLALTLEALIGPDINFYETCFVTKLPGFPGHFRDWHQDSAYFDPQTNDRNCAVAVYLDPMGPDTGATGVVPGSHRLGPLAHVTPSEGLSSRDLEVADKRRYDADGVFHDFQPGDALFFLARVVHKAGPNPTADAKTALIYNYTRRDTLDLGKKNRSTANGIPVTRAGRVHVPGGPA